MAAILNFGFNFNQLLSLLSVATQLSYEYEMDHCIVHHWLFTLADVRFHSEIYIKSCYRRLFQSSPPDNRKEVGEPPKCADWVSRGIGRSASRNCHRESDLCKKNGDVCNFIPLRSRECYFWNKLYEKHFLRILSDLINASPSFAYAFRKCLHAV